MKRLNITLLLFVCLLGSVQAQSEKLYKKLDKLATEVESDVVKWRRHIHQNPELSNREYKTGEYVANHLESLGIEVQKGVAHTGVVGILKGGKPGPVVALRADMDALPVVERTPVPFASKTKGLYNGAEVGVMHACGHDTHVAILMGAAKVLAEMKDDLPGTVKFIFQPAEEGAPKGEEGGADLMVKEGVLQNPNVDAIFGLHISAQSPAGKITLKPGGLLASADVFNIKVKGRQAHGSAPWSGADPIVASAHIITALQTIVSRNMPLTKEAAVVTVGWIKAGVRNNIIPESAEFEGTIRALDTEMQKEIHQRIREIAENTGKALGVDVEVEIRIGVPVTSNDAALTKQMLPTLEAAAGSENVSEIPARTGAEDFSFYVNEVPGVFFFLGGMEPGANPAEVGSHHTPDFYIDESGFIVGIKAMSRLAVDYMYQAGAR